MHARVGDDGQGTRHDHLRGSREDGPRPQAPAGRAVGIPERSARPPRTCPACRATLADGGAGTRACPGRLREEGRVRRGIRAGPGPTGWAIRWPSSPVPRSARRGHRTAAGAVRSVAGERTGAGHQAAHPAASGRAAALPAAGDGDPGEHRAPSACRPCLAAVNACAVETLAVPYDGLVPGYECGRCGCAGLVADLLPRRHVAARASSRRWSAGHKTRGPGSIAGGAGAQACGG